MPNKIKETEVPKGFIKTLFGLPNWFFDHHLGRLLGSRFIQLHHIGRRSGKIHKTVVEVIRHDAEADKIYICSGFKKKSDWFKNLVRTPNINVRFNEKVYEAFARKLSITEAGNELASYSLRHPSAMKALARFMGYETDGTSEDVRELAKELPVFELEIHTKQEFD